MIIFGTRGITTTPQKGDFNCPSCSSVQNYGLKRVRRFFTLYFIPVIPLDKLGEYVECMSCKDTYKPVILEYDPAANSEAIEAEYHAAIKGVMIHMLLADGVIDDSEVDMLLKIYHQISGSTLEKPKLLEEIGVIEKSSETMSSVLIRLQGSLNDEGKEMVVKAALHIALADGDFQQEEKELLAKIGADLGMTKAHLQGVINSA